MLDESGRNVFDDGTDKGSDIMRAAVAGLMDSMADATLIFAPHLNSYRRLSPGGLAPTTVGWGYENAPRRSAFPAARISTPQRTPRCRIDTNPFLVLAAILGGALDGIARMLTPAEPVTSNSHELTCRNWPRMAAGAGALRDGGRA